MLLFCCFLHFYVADVVIVEHVAAVVKRVWRVRVTNTAAVALTAVLECLMFDIEDLCGLAASDFGLDVILPQHIYHGIREEELDKLIALSLQDGMIGTLTAVR